MWPFSESYPEISLDQVRPEYDYIIVGGGTSGCVLANRLSADPSVSVLLVENGFANDTWMSRVPLFTLAFSPISPPQDRRNSLANALLGGKAHELINGIGLGGTSRVNAMIYQRGLPSEYNAWSIEGRKGWSYDELLPLFKRSQRSLEPNPRPDVGVNGEWMTRTHKTTFFEHTVRLGEAGAKLGLPYIGDYNDPDCPAYGSAKCHHTMDNRGRRQSTFFAFLPRQIAQARKNHLHICTGTIGLKIVIKPGEDGDLRARGVYLMKRTDTSGGPIFIKAAREVILCGGPLGNPQILQRSGVGSSELLKSLGIAITKDLPGVGQHLQDHLAISNAYSVPTRESFVYFEKNPAAFLLEILKYVFVGDSILTCPVVDVFIFAKSDLLDDKGHLHASAAQMNARDPANVPDIEIMPSPYDTTEEPFDKSRGRFSTMGVLLRPRSTGSVKITSPDLSKPAEIDLGILSDPEDWHVFRKAARLQRALANEMRACGYPLDDVLVPASNLDADIDAHIKRYLRTSYHYSSTCRMAPEHDARPGVVDDELRVHGIRNLRIADSSIFPTIPACHLQGPVVMVAEKCAELILRQWERT